MKSIENFKVVHVFNIQTKDTFDDATIGAKHALKLATLVLTALCFLCSID